jgi:hypothetical protein
MLKIDGAAKSQTHFQPDRVTGVADDCARVILERTHNIGVQPKIDVGHQPAASSVAPTGNCPIKISNSSGASVETHAVFIP